MLFCICCSITLPFFQYTKDAVRWKTFVFYGLLLLLSFLYNYHIKKYLFLSILCHLAIFIPLGYLPVPLMDQCLCILLWIFLTIFDLLCWCGKTRSKAMVMPLPLVFAYPVLYWYLGRNFAGSYPLLSYYFGIFYFILSLLSSYLNNTKYIEPVAKDSGYTPSKEILQSNNRLVFALAAFLLGSTILLRLQTVESFFSSILQLIKKGFLQLISYLLRLLRSHTAIPKEEELDFSPLEEGLLPAASTNPIFKLIQDILVFFVSFLIITFLLIGIATIVVRFMKKYWIRHPKGVQEIRDDFSVIVTKERVSRPKNLRRKDGRLISNQELIRHYYKKKLKSMQKNRLPLMVSQTPNERANDKSTEHTPGLKELTSYYNKARYSEDTITKEEVKQAKTYV